MSACQLHLEKKHCQFGRKEKEHNNSPVDCFLPYNRGWTSWSTQALEKRKTQWYQSTENMAQDTPAALVLFGTTPSHPTTLLLRHHVSPAWDEIFLPTYRCSHLCSHRNQQTGWRDCWDNIHVATMTSDTWNKAILHGRDCYRRRWAQTRLRC